MVKDVQDFLCLNKGVKPFGLFVVVKCFDQIQEELSHPFLSLIIK